MMKRKRVVALSGGPDSVYLFCRMLHDSRRRGRLLACHYNHRARGADSEDDQFFVEDLCRHLGIPLMVELGKIPPNRGASPASGFEERARRARQAFFRRIGSSVGATGVLLAHTADDQVETVLMRILEGAGISGLKGIPRRTGDGIERPLLDTWREDILKYLRRHKIPYRTDKSNLDTRFERNWVRHVLVPLLEKRYGKAVKKRLYTLGERFREIDEFLGATARRWMKRNVKGRSGHAAETRVPRAAYAKLPSVVRKKIVQILCFERMDVSPNERLIEAMDKLILTAKPSARLSIGKGALLSCRYGEAIFRPGEPGKVPAPREGATGDLAVREIRGKPSAARLKRLAAGERAAAFDAEVISGPLSVRPLRAGDRIRPFGATGKKKVKEILIDRKVPREERWGRPVVCDASGEIVWIPGVVRSDAAPVGRRTRRVIVLEAGLVADDLSRKPGDSLTRAREGDNISFDIK